jgi:hypothetical protein
MNTERLSFRAPIEFAEQTKARAQGLQMSISDYVREAVREKNELVLCERMAFLSATLSREHLAENDSMDASTGDALGEQSIHQVRANPRSRR